MITLEELLCQVPWDSIPKDHQENLKDLLVKINKIRSAYNRPMIVTSGYRTKEDQKRINPGAPFSGHLRGECVDIADSDGELAKWILKNLEMAKDLGFWFEHFGYTHPKNKGWWVHFSIKPPKSNKRIFIPSSSLNPNPEFWDGKYDLKFDK
jgi:hypothetical protein